MRRTVEQLLDNGEAEFPIIGASLDGRYDGEGARIAATASNGSRRWCPAARPSRPAWSRAT